MKADLRKLAFFLLYPHQNNYILKTLCLGFIVKFMGLSLAWAQPQNTSGLRFLALGDSYTIGESVPVGGRWPLQLAFQLGKKGLKFREVSIIARTGWRTDQLYDSLMSRPELQNYDLVSLLIGVNNQYQGRDTAVYRQEFTQLLEEAVRRAGGRVSRVFVVSIPDYGCTPFGKAKAEKIAREIDMYNALIREITRAAGIRYFDITPISRQAVQDPSLVAEDELHPSEKMYAAWVKLMWKEVRQMLR
ncbi:MAG: SGNH/GDSL hydrolase family protein [Microscillaceae bacterium]